MPRADGAGVLPEALPGEVPDPAHPPSGCRFHPRCPYAFDRCPVEEPPLLELTAERCRRLLAADAGRPPEPLANLAAAHGVE